MRITDLGVARLWRENNGKDTSGTPGYMGKYFNSIKLIVIAPEVMCH